MLGKRIRQARLKAGMTQEELAKRLEMRQSNLSELERREDPGYWIFLCKLARTLRVPLDYFVH